MTAKVLNGKDLASKLRSQLKREVAVMACPGFPEATPASASAR